MDFVFYSGLISFTYNVLSELKRLNNEEHISAISGTLSCKQFKFVTVSLKMV